MKRTIKGSNNRGDKQRIQKATTISSSEEFPGFWLRLYDD